MTEPIYERVWDAFTQHLHHAHYHDPQTAATPATEAPMSLLSTVEAEIHALADHARHIEQEVLPAAVTGAQDVEKLAASPVGQALLSIAHVPAGAIERLLIPAISFLSEAFPAPGAAAVADPAMGQQPEPAPAA
jgi:hypothetical protein